MLLSCHHSPPASSAIILSLGLVGFSFVPSFSSGLPTSQPPTSYGMTSPSFSPAGLFFSPPTGFLLRQARPVFLFPSALSPSTLFYLLSFFFFN